jgi:hypothetical protein
MYVIKDIRDYVRGTMYNVLNVRLSKLGFCFRSKEKMTIVKSQPKLKDFIQLYFCRIDIRNCKIAIKIERFYQKKKLNICYKWYIVINDFVYKK